DGRWDEPGREVGRRTRPESPPLGSDRRGWDGEVLLATPDAPRAEPRVNGQTAGSTRPVHSPRAMVLPLGPGAVARMQTSSPSRRKVNSLPSLSVIGSEPPQQISRKDPRWKRSRPEMVPPAKKSPARSPAPLMVMWASIWAAVQYVSANGATETTSPLSRISICRSKDQGAALVSSR